VNSARLEICTPNPGLAPGFSCSTDCQPLERDMPSHRGQYHARRVGLPRAGALRRKLNPYTEHGTPCKHGGENLLEESRERVALSIKNHRHIRIPVFPSLNRLYIGLSGIVGGHDGNVTRAAFMRSVAIFR
jgi:hypothetical protein